jgi:hypothetical protein
MEQKEIPMQILITMLILVLAIETMRRMLWINRERILQALAGAAPKPEIILCEEGSSVIPFRQRIYRVSASATLRQAA